MPMDKSTAGFVMLGATQGVAIFTSLMPNRSALYNATPTHAVKQNVRQGELVATTLTLGFAGVLTLLTKDRAPLTIAAASVITLILAYEYTLHAQPIGGTGNDIA